MRNITALVAEAPPALADPEDLNRNNLSRRDRPDRIGQRLIAAHFDNDTLKTFKILCAEEGSTTQGMVSEALELLFRKYNKPVNDQLATQATQRR